MAECAFIPRAEAEGLFVELPMINNSVIE